MVSDKRKASATGAASVPSGNGYLECWSAGSGAWPPRACVVHSGRTVRHLQRSRGWLHLCFLSSRDLGSANAKMFQVVGRAPGEVVPLTEDLLDDNFELHVPRTPPLSEDFDSVRDLPVRYFLWARKQLLVDVIWG